MRRETAGFNSAIVIISPCGKHGRRVPPCTWSGDQLTTVEVPDDWSLNSYDVERDELLSVPRASEVQEWHGSCLDLANAVGATHNRKFTGMHHESACITITIT